MARKTKEEIHQETQERDRLRRESELATYYVSVLECIAFIHHRGDFKMSNVSFSEEYSEGITPPAGYFDITVPRNFIKGADEQTYRIFKDFTVEDPLFDRKIYHLRDMQDMVQSRIIQDKEEIARRETRERALAKLTKEERELLGVA